MILQIGQDFNTILIKKTFLYIMPKYYVNCIMLTNVTAFVT